MDIQEDIKAKCMAVDPVLRKYARMGDAKVQEMIVHPIDAGGKRIRPCLTLLACEAVGFDPNKALPAAAAVELLHTFTLVHDDIMDHDAERRGRPTVHSIWGDEMGIIVGDTLYASAFKALVDVRKNGVPAERVLDAVDALVEANSQLQEGQIMDMLFEQRGSVGEEEYMGMIRNKTGSLIEATVKIGCIIGGGGPRELEAFSVYGINAGVAFQIKDDILDLTANPEELGKPIGSDIRKGKKTLIIVHAMEHYSDEDKKGLFRALGKKDITEDEVQGVIDKLKANGSIEYAQKKVEHLVDEGKRALDVLPDSKAKQTLKELADYLIERRS